MISIHIGKPLVEHYDAVKVRDLVHRGVISANDSKVVFGGVAVSIARTACNYGGTRPWFVCPVSHCRRRAAVLYCTGAGVICRRCAGLAYMSQREPVYVRALHRRHKLLARLRARGLCAENLSRPRGMHTLTYSRLLEKLATVERASHSALSVWAGLVEKTRSAVMSKNKD